MGGLFIAGAAWWVGASLLRPLRLRTPERPLLEILVGLALVALVALTIGAWSLQIAAMVVAVMAILGLATPLRRLLAGDLQDRHRRPFTLIEWAALLPLVAIVAMTTAASLVPVTGWDATVAHLALPQDYVQQGRITVDPGNVYSGYPQLIHVLYAVALEWGGVPLLHSLFLLLTLGAMASLGNVAFSRLAAVLAMLVLATSPIFVDQAAAPGVDLPFLAFTLAALTCVWRWRQSAVPAWLVVAGFLAGASCGIRHTGLLCGALLLVGLPVVSRRGRKFSVAVFGVSFALAAVPWLVRSTLATGNPVFPFLLAWFPEGPIPHTHVSGIGVHESTQSFSWRGFLLFPWDIVMRPGDFDGWSKSPGGLLLALGVPGLLLGGRAARALGAFTLAGGVAFYFFQRLARYLLPFFGPMMVLAAALPGRSRKLRPLALALLLLTAAFGVALHAAAISFKVPVLLGQQSRHDYLAGRVERYESFVYANQTFKRGGKVLTLDQRSYYLTPPSYQNHWGLMAIRDLPLAEQVAWLRDQGIAYVILPVDFVRESGMLRDELLPMLQQWRRAPQFFTLVNSLDTPRRDGSGMEKVEFYKLVEAQEGGA